MRGGGGTECLAANDDPKTDKMSESADLNRC